MQPTSLEVFKTKYAFGTEEVPEDSFHRIAYALAKQEAVYNGEIVLNSSPLLIEGLSLHQSYWYHEFLTALQNGAIPAGRITSNIGAEASKPNTSLINCTVSRNVHDSIEGIATTIKEAMLTLAKGCGIGYCCSSLRPKDAFVNGVGAATSGSLSFMEIFDTMCSTIASAGGRRGAQMLTMHIWHPDIFEFIKKKREVGKFTQFNMSVLVTKEFMEAKEKDLSWDLYFPLHKKEDTQLSNLTAIRDFPFNSEDYTYTENGSVACKIYQTVRARDLWDLIMESTYEYAEPGVLFIDEINEGNPLNGVETIVSTNPCVTGDTLILTEDGYKPIINCVGIETSVWNGKQFSVVTPKVTGEFKELLEIGFSDGATLKCTENHKFLIAGNSTRVEAKDLSYGMKLEKFTLPVIHGSKEHPDARYAYTWGFYCGDGNSTGGSDIWLYGEKQELRDKLLGTHVWVDSVKDRSQVRLDNWNVGFKTQVPDSSMTVKFRLDWLAGLIDSDGTRSSKEGGFSVWSVDKDFLLKVRLMLNTLGVQANVVLGKEACTKLMPDGMGGYKEFLCQESYRLLVSVWNCKQLLNMGLKTYRVDLACNPNRDAGRFITVTSIKEAGIADKVYCFTEPLEHKGIFNGILTGNCGEQPLPEYGSCLLGSIILSKFVKNPFNVNKAVIAKKHQATFDWELFDKTTRTFVRMLDNVVELHGLALPEQAHEILYKRRHGMGYTGLGTALNLLGIKYGSAEAVAFTEEVTKRLAVINLEESYRLGEEKGCAPIFEDEGVYENWLHHPFTQKVMKESQLRLTISDGRRPRFTHATSIAPTGTLSIAYGNNCSNGIEPSFAHSYYRNLIVSGKKTKKRVEVLSEEAYLWRERYGDVPYPDWFVTAQDITPEEHVAMQAAAQKWVDSSISKTINVPAETSFESFKHVYDLAYANKLKGCTTYRPQAGFTAVLQTKESLQNTFYKFTLEDGSEVEFCAFDTVWYDGEEHEVENLYCALNQGYYGQL